MRVRFLSHQPLFYSLVLLALLTFAPKAHAQAMTDRPSPGHSTRPVAEQPSTEPTVVMSLRQRIAEVIESLKANWRQQAAVESASTRTTRFAWARRASH